MADNGPTRHKRSSPSPRMFAGGYAPRKRGDAPQSAPGWTDMAASATMGAIMVVLSKRDDLVEGPGLFYHLLTDPSIRRTWSDAMGPALKRDHGVLATAILDSWASKITTPGGKFLRLNKAFNKLKSAFRVLQLRAAVCSPVGTLFVERTDSRGAADVKEILRHANLAHPPAEERRPKPGGRALRLMATWDWSEFEGTAFVCFERHRGQRSCAAAACSNGGGGGGGGGGGSGAGQAAFEAVLAQV